MAYSKVSNKTQDKDVKYLNKDYNSFKDQLMEFAEVYFPNNFNDFNEGNPGMMFMEMAAYVGDVLSFYLDYQTNESFLDTSIELDNIIRHGRELGYKHERFSTAHGKVSFYILVPANSNGIGVDSNYIPMLRKGSTFNGTNGKQYYGFVSCIERDLPHTRFQ